MHDVKLWSLRVGGTLAALGVATGALGAHALEERLTPEDLATYETAVRYQFYGAFGQLAVVAASAAGFTRRLGAAAICLALGTVMFSGSIYALVFGGAGAIFGPITPLGGVLLLIGFALLATTGRSRTTC